MISTKICFFSPVNEKNTTKNPNKWKNWILCQANKSEMKPTDLITQMSAYYLLYLNIKRESIKDWFKTFSVFCDGTLQVILLLCSPHIQVFIVTFTHKQQQRYSRSKMGLRCHLVIVAESAKSNCTLLLLTQQRGNGQHWFPWQPQTGRGQEWESTREHQSLLQPPNTGTHVHAQMRTKMHILSSWPPDTNTMLLDSKKSCD